MVLVASNDNSAMDWAGRSMTVAPPVYLAPGKVVVAEVVTLELIRLSDVESKMNDISRQHRQNWFRLT
jgi:hypothetical protein